jgi:hypothetical protein
VGTIAVNEAVMVMLGVHDGVIEGVNDAVKVIDGVSVEGWNGVNVIVDVEVLVGVNVCVGVALAVPVSTIGDGLADGVSLSCNV